MRIGLIGAGRIGVFHAGAAATGAHPELIKRGVRSGVPVLVAEVRQ